MTFDPDRPGFNDLTTPFIFVKHGDPDPVEWKQAHPGWVSFPATFVPHKRPAPKWPVLNGRRWPLDKRGQPWPRSRFGQPMCPLDEFPPGVPAPGTRGEQMRFIEEAPRKVIENGGADVAWFLAESARHRAEREARAAANPAPPPPSPDWDPIKDPSAPLRTYRDYRVREASIMRELVVDSDGLGSVREYREVMARVDASMHEFAAGARQRNAMRAQRERMVEIGTGAALSTPAGAADEPDANTNMLTPVQFASWQAWTNTAATEVLSESDAARGSTHDPL